MEKYFYPEQELSPPSQGGVFSPQGYNRRKGGGEKAKAKAKTKEEKQTAAGSYYAPNSGFRDV